MNWTEFFAMGGYAFYVWTSWGLTALIFLWQFIQPKRRRRLLIKQIKRQIQREQQQ